MTVLLAQAADPDEVRRTVEDVLSQADYTVTGGPSLLDRVLNEVLEQLGRFLLQFDRDGGDGSLLAALALVLVVVALVVALVIFLLRLRRSRTLEPVVEGPVGRPAVAWAEEAERHERAGELREALRCRYRETVARLAAGGLVEEVPGRTTGEYARQVAVTVPVAREPFATLTTRFEDVWYGGRAVDAAGLAEVRDVQRAVARAAGVDAGDRRGPVRVGV